MASEPTPDESLQGGRRSTWAILTIAGLGAFIAALDQTVVVTALPSVMLDLKIPITELDRVSWIITAYLLGYTVAMPLIGRLGDVYGYPRVYQAALVVFCIGTSLVAVAQSFEFMIGARVIQAIGGGATVPLGMALATTLVPPERRALALGVVGGAAEAGSMLGPAYGGAIVELSSWRWIFWLNVPQSAVVFVALMRLPGPQLIPLRRGPSPSSAPRGAENKLSSPRRGGRAGREPRVDYLGGALLIAALLLLSLGLSRSDLFTLASPVPFILAASGLGIGGVLVAVERRTWQPLLAHVFLRSWGFILSNLTQALVGVSLIIALVTVPLTADTVMQKDPFTGAMWLLRMTGVIPLASVVGGLLLPWAGGRTLTVAGLLMVATGLFFCSRWEVGVNDPELTLQLLLTGAGFGLVIAPILHRALQSVGEDYRATAASLVTVARMMGMTLGLAAISAWGVEHFQFLTAGLELPIPQSGESTEALNARVEQYTTGVNIAGLSVFRAFFRAAAIVALAAIPLALLQLGKAPTEQSGSREIGEE